MCRTAVIIPTYNGRQDLSRLLDTLARQQGEFDVLVVDSGSRDGTAQVAASHPVVNQLVSIDSADFNHGGTRQMMVDRFADYDIYVFLTQDAYPYDASAISELVAPFQDVKVGAVCGRQLPHQDANLFAQHARLQNYPSHSHVASAQDIPVLGIKAAFMSNSFGAYRRTALLAVGGFPSDTILAEDMAVAARMLQAGWKVAYAAQAQVYHSHNYTLCEEWRRYFDIGVFHARQPWIRTAFGGAGGEGMRFVRSELRYLAGKPYLWPQAMVRNAGKLLAYKLGQRERYLPLGLKRAFSMHRSYWSQEARGAFRDHS